MELWLLGAGAIVLIAITLWIVWPAHSADSVGDPVPNPEASTTDMAEHTGSDMPPQGARFEDQYTSATADLSAGGVAAAGGTLNDDTASSHSVPTQEPVPPARGQRWPEASTEGERIGQASRSDNFPYSQGAFESRSFVQPKTIGVGAGTLLTLGAAAGGAWLYARWQRERNKPINRLRRGARGVAHRMSDYLPEMDDLPLGPAPVGGAASALLLSALLASRALRKPPPDEQFDGVREQARELVRDSLREVLGRGRDAMSRRDELVDRAQAVDSPTPAVMGLGFGGLAIVAGGSYLVWRLLRGVGASPQRTWYAGE
jgi:hypothetical protein